MLLNNKMPIFVLSASENSQHNAIIENIAKTKYNGARDKLECISARERIASVVNIFWLFFDGLQSYL